MADLMPGVGDFLSSSQAASRMFSGFKSVCIKSRPCKYATLSSNCRPKSRTTSILNGRYWFTRRKSYKLKPSFSNT